MQTIPIALHAHIYIYFKESYTFLYSIDIIFVDS